MTLLASDSFTGTNGTAWSTSLWGNGLAPAGSSSIITGNVGRLTCGTTTATTGSSSGRVARRILLSSTTLVNAVALFKFRWPTGDECYPRFYCRSTNSLLDSQGGYYIEIGRPFGGWYVGKNDSYGGGSLPTGFASNNVVSSEVITKSFSANTWYWCRFGVVGNAIKARIWDDGTTEPTSWNVQVTDNQFTTGGQATGFSLGNGSTPNAKWEIDDFSLDSAFPTITTVAGVSTTSTNAAPAGTLEFGYVVEGPSASSTGRAPDGGLIINSNISAEPISGYVNAIAGLAGQGLFLDGTVASATATALAGDVTAALVLTAPPSTSTWKALIGTATVPMILDPPQTLQIATVARSGTATGERDNVRIGSAKVRVTYRDLLTGQPCTGVVAFTPAAFIASDDLLVPNRVAVGLDGTGTLDVDLPCGKDQATLPLVAYLVEENLDAPSVGRDPFYLLLTPGDDGQIVDLAAVPMEVNVPDLSLYMLKTGGTFSGPVTIASTLTATENVALGANLTVAHAVLAESLELSGDATADGSLTVGGSASIEGGLEAGQVSSPVYSGGEFTGDVDIDGQLHVGSDLLVTGNATVATNFAVSGTVQGPLRIGGIIALKDDSAPNTDNEDGGYLYSEDGALKWRGSDSTVTILAPA